MTAYELIHQILKLAGYGSSDIWLLASERDFLKKTEVFIPDPEGSVEGAVIPLEKAPEIKPIYAWPDHSDNLEAYTTEWPSNFTDCPREEWQGLVIR